MSLLEVLEITEHELWEIERELRQIRAMISANQETILAQLQAIQTKEMEMGDAIQNLAASVETNFAATKAQLTSIATGVTALDAKIVALQAQIAAGLSPADQAALQQLVTDSAALATQAKAIDTTPPAGS